MILIIIITSIIYFLLTAAYSSLDTVRQTRNYIGQFASGGGTQFIHSSSKIKGHFGFSYSA